MNSTSPLKTKPEVAKAIIQTAGDPMQAIFDSSLQLFIFIDCQYKIQAFNKIANENAQKVMNRPIIKGASIYDFVHPHDLKDFNHNFHQALNGTLVRVEKNIKAPDNNNWFEFVYAPVRDEQGFIIGVCIGTLNIDACKKAQLALTRSEERYRALVQNSADLITIIAPNGTILYQSPSAEWVLGYHQGELIGKNYFEYLHPKDSPAIQHFITLDPSLSQMRIPLDFQFRCANNTWVYLEAFYNNLSDNPAVGGIVINARDVTERRQAEERLGLLERAVESTSDGIVITDATQPDNLVIYVNPAFEYITGYESYEVLGSNCRFLQGNDTDQPALQELRQAMQAQQECRVVLRNYRKDGTLFWNELRLSPIRNSEGTVLNFVGVQTDITERKKVECMKSEFISVVSHELRTPLTAIRGAFGLLAGGAAGVLPAPAQVMVDIAHKNSLRLLHLINDLLDIEKLTSGNMVFDSVPLELMKIVEQSLEINKAYAEQYGVTFSLEQTLPEIQVQGDSNRLMQVLTNLLSNAAKFSPSGGQVLISVCQPSKAYVRVSITNQGEGIPVEFHSRIFQKFSQADSSDVRKKGGTGLGLYISKAIIEKLGGNINFTSAKDEGTTFYFDLPQN